MSSGTRRPPINVSACSTPIASRSLAQNTASGRRRRAVAERLPHRAALQHGQRRGVDDLELGAGHGGDRIVGTAEPVADLTQLDGTAHESDSPAAGVAQMADGQPGAGHVVNGHRVELGSAGVPIDQDDGRPAGVQRGQPAQVITDGRDQ